MKKLRKYPYDEKLIVINIDATKNHCNNNCHGMVHYTSENKMPPSHCMIFNQQLDWDEKKKQNGYKRLAVCRKNELDIWDLKKEYNDVE